MSPGPVIMPVTPAFRRSRTFAFFVLMATELAAANMLTDCFEKTVH
jgi:hypothetical protein